MSPSPPTIDSWWVQSSAGRQHCSEFMSAAVISSPEEFSSASLAFAFFLTPPPYHSLSFGKSGATLSAFTSSQLSVCLLFLTSQTAFFPDKAEWMLLDWRQQLLTARRASHRSYTPRRREREAKGSLPCLECEGRHRGLLTETHNIGATFDGENSVNAQSP